MCQKLSAGSTALPELYDIHGRRLQVGDRLLVATSHRHPSESETRVAVLRTRTVYELAYEQPTSSGVASINLAYSDELSDLQRRGAVKITDEPINSVANVTT